jgi:hypothetical protein
MNWNKSEIPYEVLLTKLGSYYKALFLNTVLVLLVDQFHQIEYTHKLSKYFPDCAHHEK